MPTTGEEVVVRAKGDKWSGRTGTVVRVAGQPKAQLVDVKIGDDTLVFWDFELEAVR
jgi:hypothetical protein